MVAHNILHSTLVHLQLFSPGKGGKEESGIPASPFLAEGKIFLPILLPLLFLPLVLRPSLMHPLSSPVTHSAGPPGEPAGGERAHAKKIPLPPSSSSDGRWMITAELRRGGKEEEQGFKPPLKKNWAKSDRREV